MIIDFHTHVLPPRIKSDRSRCVEIDFNFAAIYADKKAKIATAEDLIENMDRDGVDISVIVNYGWSTPGLCAETNDYILESAARYPKRLYGFCAVADYSSASSLKEIERCARGGARGIGELRPDIQSPGFTDKSALEPFAEVLKRHRLPLLVHSSEPVGHIYPGKGAATPDILYRFISAFPGLSVVCAHWGGGLPFYALMPEVGEALKNVWFDTAASPFLYKPEIYGQVSRIAGAGKILFGSDFPLMRPERLLKEINAAGLSADTKNLILSGNAGKLLGLVI
jgi:hypothetical protein